MVGRPGGAAAGLRCRGGAEGSRCRSDLSPPGPWSVSGRSRASGWASTAQGGLRLAVGRPDRRDIRSRRPVDLHNLTKTLTTPMNDGASLQRGPRRFWTRMLPWRQEQAPRREASALLSWTSSESAECLAGFNPLPIYTQRRTQPRASRGREPSTARLLSALRPGGAADDRFAKFRRHWAHDRIGDAWIAGALASRPAAGEAATRPRPHSAGAVRGPTAISAPAGVADRRESSVRVAGGRPG